eukprot:6855356-Ditylum_brightwellii.AAC.1
MGEMDRFIMIRGGRFVVGIEQLIPIGSVEITTLGFGHIIQEQGCTNIRGNPRVMGNHIMACSFRGYGCKSDRVDVSHSKRQYLNDIKAIMEVHSIVGNRVIRCGNNGGRQIGGALILCHIDMIRRLKLRRAE